MCVGMVVAAVWMTMVKVMVEVMVEEVAMVRSPRTRSMHTDTTHACIIGTCMGLASNAGSRVVTDVGLLARGAHVPRGR